MRHLTVHARATLLTVHELTAGTDATEATVRAMIQYRRPNGIIFKQMTSHTNIGGNLAIFAMIRGTARADRLNGLTEQTKHFLHIIAIKRFRASAVFIMAQATEPVSFTTGG